MGRESAGGERGGGRDVLRHVTALDGVRGCAILMVLINHLLWSNSETGSRLMNVFVRVREAGWVGVDLFYALSGFLITGILFDSLGDRHYLKNFYMRRVLRIMPLYYGVATVLFLLLRLGTAEAGLLRPYLLLLSYLSNTPCGGTASVDRH